MVAPVNGKQIFSFELTGPELSLDIFISLFLSFQLIGLLVQNKFKLCTELLASDWLI